MFRRLKNQLVGKSSPQQFNGFVLERFDAVHVSGWVVPRGRANPVDINFQVFERGCCIEFSAHFFHREALSENRSNNLYGFRLRFKQRIDDIKHASLFYIDENDRVEPIALPNIKGSMLDVSTPVYFLNLMASQAKLNDEPLPSKKILEISPSIEQKQEKDFDGIMAELTNEDISTFYIQSGVRSRNGVAITGKSGHIFLHGGSNRVDELFRDSTIHCEKADGWLSLIEERQEAANLSGYRYLQIVIPEKQSLLPDNYYRQAPRQSRLLQIIEGEMPASYFSIYDAFSSHVGDDLFYKTDSHFNAQGNFLLFDKIMNHLDLEHGFSPNFHRQSKFVGDLGSKYYPMKLWERTRTASNIPKHNRRIEYRHAPSNKGHIGQKIHWVNSDAPIKLKIMVFGNSFSEIGTMQNHLTFWLSHCFEECYFVWAAEFDYKLIENFKPNLVIGQSIERFLRIVPRR